MTWTILHSYHQHESLVFPLLPLHLVLPVFFMLAVLGDDTLCLIVVLSCLSLMINNVGHFFISWLAIFTFSLEKYLFKSFCYWWRCYCSSQDSVLRVMKNEADRHGATSKAFNEEWTSERKRTPGNWEGLQGKMPLRQQCWGTYKHKKEEVYIIGWGCF